MLNQYSRRNSSWHVIKNLVRALVVLLLLVTFFERPARAYTDPSSMALLWQILVAAVLGVSIYFRRFFAWIARRKKNDSDDE